jgi:peptidoglycan/xylan/chitin deacetylase (PgdA/CDA1 family)
VSVRHHAELPPLGHPLAGLLTVMWHYVRDPDDEPRVGSGAIRPRDFDRQLDLIARHRTVVGWQAVADALDGVVSLPPNPALLTFDDGLVDHHRTVGPRLVARGWVGVFFAMARATDDPLSVGHRIHILLADRSPAQLRKAVLERLDNGNRRRFEEAEAREAAAGVDPIDVLKRPLQRDVADAAGPILSDLIEERHGDERAVANRLHLSDADVAGLRHGGMTIAGHGRRHLWFDHEPEDRVAAEIEASATWLGREPRPWAFAYPYGAGAPAATTALERCGFAAAFHARPTASTGRWDLGRVDAEDEAFAATVAAQR